MPDFVNIAVPEDRVLEVYALLAQPPTQPASSNGRTQAPPAAAEPWPRETVVRAVVESANPMRDALVVMARAGDNGVTTQELADHFRFERGTAAVAGMFGAFVRRCRNRYGQTTHLWDVSYPQLADGSGYETRVVMRARFRSAIEEAANE